MPRGKERGEEARLLARKYGPDVAERPGEAAVLLAEHEFLSRVEAGGGEGGHRIVGGCVRVDAEGGGGGRYSGKCTNRTGVSKISRSGYRDTPLAKRPEWQGPDIGWCHSYAFRARRRSKCRILEQKDYFSL